MEFEHTGRDKFLIAQALATAIVVIDNCNLIYRQASNREDMLLILANLGGTTADIEYLFRLGETTVTNQHESFPITERLMLEMKAEGLATYPNQESKVNPFGPRPN